MPDYEAFMLPLLRVLAQAPSSIPSAASQVADRLDISADVRDSKPSWAHEPLMIARTRVTAEALDAAKLITRTDDQLALAQRGQALLDENPSSLSRETLRRYPEFEAYLQAHLARQGA